ncbi:hypothetical protein OS175_04185, partial [Marinicella sp. S1101]|uniref:hypothetical protein n=1 Tax=Marinicella marina TaxID=2996016 RepID=UPI002260F064
MFNVKIRNAVLFYVFLVLCGLNMPSIGQPNKAIQAKSVSYDFFKKEIVTTSCSTEMCIAIDVEGDYYINKDGKIWKKHKNLIDEAIIDIQVNNNGFWVGLSSNSIFTSTNGQDWERAKSLEHNFFKSYITFKNEAWIINTDEFYALSIDGKSWRVTKDWSSYIFNVALYQEANNEISLYRIGSANIQKLSLNENANWVDLDYLTIEFDPEYIFAQETKGIYKETDYGIEFHNLEPGSKWEACFHDERPRDYTFFHITPLNKTFFISERRSIGNSQVLFSVENCSSLERLNTKTFFEKRTFDGHYILDDDGAAFVGIPKKFNVSLINSDEYPILDADSSNENVIRLINKKDLIEVHNGSSFRIINFEDDISNKELKKISYSKHLDQWAILTKSGILYSNENSDWRSNENSLFENFLDFYYDQFLKKWIFYSKDKIFLTSSFELDASDWDVFYPNGDDELLSFSSNSGNHISKVIIGKKFIYQYAGNTWNSIENFDIKSLDYSPIDSKWVSFGYTNESIVLKEFDRILTTTFNEIPIEYYSKRAYENSLLISQDITQFSVMPDTGLIIFTTQLEHNYEQQEHIYVLNRNRYAYNLARIISLSFGNISKLSNGSIMGVYSHSLVSFFSDSNLPYIIDEPRFDSSNKIIFNVESNDSHCDDISYDFLAQPKYQKFSIANAKNIKSGS